MRSEADVPKAERFLLTAGRLGKPLIQDLDGQIIRFLEKHTGTLKIEYAHAISRYFNRNKSQDDAYFTLYAYADLEKARSFSLLLPRNMDQPPIKIGCRIDHIIYEGWFPSETIEDGHKHILFLKFETEPPNIPTFNDWGELNRAKCYFKLLG